MGDIEEAFLQQNVPGRYSSWTDDGGGDRRGAENDSASADGGSDSEDDEFYFEGLPPQHQAQPPAPAADANPQLRAKGNTGVKGVLADYREAQLDAKLQREEEQLERMEALQRATRPAVSNRVATNDEKGRNVKEESGLDDSDDEFLQKFRRQRLAEMKSAPSLPSFGTLDLLSPEEYVELVDSIDPRVFLVVHLCDPSMQQCQMLHSALDKVAHTMDFVRFVEVDAMEANPNLDTICLPALLVYRGGKMVHNLVRFTDDLPRGFGMEAVRDALEGVGIVDPRRVGVDE
ncbi:hypothetical protein ACHAXT_009217 [Thalassiosira profunda]